MRCPRDRSSTRRRRRPARPAAPQLRRPRRRGRDRAAVRNHLRNTTISVWPTLRRMADPDGGRGIPRELSRGEIGEFLRGQRIARLGCHADGVTYVVPLIYAYGDGAVVAVTTEGRKTAMLRENPRVCVEVDEYDADGKGSWRSVIAHGTYAGARRRRDRARARSHARALRTHRGPRRRAAAARPERRRPPHRPRRSLGSHRRTVNFSCISRE